MLSQTLWNSISIGFRRNSSRQTQANFLYIFNSTVKVNFLILCMQNYTCNPQSLLQTTQLRISPEITLIKALKCNAKMIKFFRIWPSCHTKYFADMSGVLQSNNKHSKVY